MRVAIVGLGVMGRNWYRVLRHCGVDTVTIDPAGHADRKAMRGVKADAWVIATPPEYLAACAHQAEGPLLVEKPGAHDLPPCSVGYVERFNPAFCALQERIGDIVSVRTERLGPARLATSPVIDLATHDLDLLDALDLDRTPHAAHHHAGHSVALLECGILEASHLHSVKARRISVTGTPNLSADLIRQRVWVDGEEISVTKAEPLALQAQAFLDGYLTVDEQSASETLRVAEVIDATGWESPCATDRSVPQTRLMSSPT